MTKERKQKIKKWSIRIGAGFLAFAAGLAATFFLVPGRIRNIVFDEPQIEVAEETHFSKFVTRLMNTIDSESDETMEGVVGTIDNLTVEWPQNKITIDGELALSMRNINDLDLTVDLSVDYNSKKVDLGIGYTDRTFYLAFNDLFIKSSYVNTQDVFDKIYQLFFNAEAPEDEGLGITLDIDDILDSVIGGIDIGSLTSGGSGGGLGITFGDEVEAGTNKIKAPLSITLGEGKEPINLSLFLNTETNDLCGVSLEKVEIGDVKINGGLTFDIFKDHKVYGFDNEMFDGIRDYSSKTFIEVVNYKSWFDDIFNLLNKKTVGIDLDFSVDQDDGSGRVNIGQIGGAIDVDASKFILPIPKIINSETFAKDNIVTTKVVKRGSNGEESVVDTILDNLNAGIGLSVNRGDTHYADLNLTYADQSAYLSLNKDVIKTKMDIQTLNLLISKISPLIEGSDEEVSKKLLRNETQEPEEPGLFDFITSSELVTAIKSGKYDGIIDLIENISNTNNGINLKLNLSSLGLGENAKVELNLDATDNGEKGVTSIKCSEIQMAEGYFNLDLSTRNYKKESIETVLSDSDNYEPLDFAVGVLDQVSNILDSKKTGFELSGSLLGSDNLGMEFSGAGQLDYGERYGYGSLEIRNRTNPENPTKIKDEDIHPIDLYVDNTTEDKEANSMKLAYGPTRKLKGQLSVKSLEDIVGVVIKLINNNLVDRRFAKFLDPIVKMIYESKIGQIISSKDYLQLAHDNFVKAINQENNGSYLQLVLGKDLFAGFLTEDLEIRLNFNKTEDSKTLESLEIVDLNLNETLGSKIVNLKVTLKDFDEEFKNPIKLTDTFMNFSSLATLMTFLIDSTELNSYHLTAHINAKLGSVITLLQFDLDFYIEVLGENTRVYGKFPNVPYIILASNDSNADVNTEFIFEPAKHYDPNSNDSVGGYFHILRNEDHHGWTNRNFEQYYYRATSKGFLDNIASYLLAACLDFKYALVSQIGEINLDSSATPVYENMFNNNGFVDKSNAASNKFEWDVDLNLGALTGIEAFNSLQAKLYGENETLDNGVEKSYLRKLEGKLPIQASIIKIEADATINLVDIDSKQNGWVGKQQFISDRYEAVVGIYNNMTSEEKASYDLTYLNQPKTPYQLKGNARLDTTTPSIFSK